LALHPEVDARLATEAAQLGDRRATAEDLDLLVYTTAVIKESMRLPAEPATSPEAVSTAGDRQTVNLLDKRRVFPFPSELIVSRACGVRPQPSSLCGAAADHRMPHG
jgi:cytochrome P450